MRAIVVRLGALGIAALLACGGKSDEAGGADGAAGVGDETGGSSGSGGVAGTGSGSEDGGVGGGSSCGCVEQELRWDYDGGFVAYNESSTLESCHTFTFARATFESDPTTTTCTDPIESCEGTVNPGDVQAALAHRDVVAAFAASPVLFGRDARGVDGQVFQIHLGSGLIEIGYECTGASDCIDAPPGVVTLRMHLETLTADLLLRPPCSDVFPE